MIRVIQQLEHDLAMAQGELANLYMAREQIKHLHTPVNGPYDNLICKHCTYILLISRPDAPEDAFIMYPCPTVNIVLGEEDEQ